MNRAKLKKKREERMKLDEEIRILELKEVINNTASFNISCRPAGKSDLASKYIEFDNPSELSKLKMVILELLS